MNTKTKLTSVFEETLVKEYLNGVRTGLIADKYGISPNTVRVILKKNGHADIVSINKGGTTGRNTQNFNNEINELHKDGLSQQEIGRGLNISQSVVSRVLRELGVPPNKSAKNQLRENNNKWKGGRTINGEGYVNVKPDKFFCMMNKQGYVPEHRYVMSLYLDRPLEKWESVHHIDGNKLNNKIENLQLRIGKHGKNQAYKCKDCGSNNIYPVKLD